MQKRVKPRRRLRVRKPRRADVLPSKLNELDLEAPEGRYKVDSLTCELQACGWLVPGHYNKKLLQPRKILREAVNVAGKMALDHAQYPREHLNYKQIAKSFFEKLRDVQKSISFICGVDPQSIASTTDKHGVELTDEYHGGYLWEDIFSETDILIENLKNTKRHVETYLELHWIPKLPGGNEDLLGSAFVQRMAVFGRLIMGARPPLQNTDVKLFSTLLDAGWTDLKFPLKNHRGQSLEPLDLYFEVRVKNMLKANRL